MADEEYHKKLRDLQKYVPFLENTIKRLKTETGKPREAQISKLQSLLVILTNTKKKLKYDALKKCEEVILKLYDKVEKKPTSGETMHKYMCRNPPEDKFSFEMKSSSPVVDNEVAFSVARQKLNKQAEMTPASPSPPLEPPVVAPKPVVIPTEKIAVEETRTADAFFVPIVNNEFNQPQPSIYHQEPWSNFQEMVPPNPQTINWPSSVFTQSVNPVITPQINHFPQEPPIIPPFFQPQPQQWPVVNPEPLYLRRNDLNKPNLDAKYDVWKNQNLSRKPNSQNREIIDYSDSFGIDSSPKIDDVPKPVPAPAIAEKEPPKKEENIIKPLIIEPPKKELISIKFPPLKKNVPPIVSSLNKPPLSESDLQDLLSSSTTSPNSEEASPLVNEDMDLEKLEELKEKLCKELEENKKKDKSNKSNSQPSKPKSPRVIERVVKEQDNIFGSLLSSIDKQIIGKAKEHHKKPEKKDLPKDKKSSSSSSSHKKDKDKHKDDKPKDKEKKKDDKDKSISKSDVSKLNEKVKSLYFKDSKQPHKKEDSSSSKPKSNKDKDSKSKDSKDSKDSKSSSSKSKTDKDKSSSKEKEDKTRKDNKQKVEDIKQTIEDLKKVELPPLRPEPPKIKLDVVEPPKKVEEETESKIQETKKSDEPKNEMHVVDKIMEGLKACIKEKKVETLSKFGDSVREMQENLIKSDSNHSVTSDSSKDSKDEKVLNSGRLSDKYPHKRKPSIDRAEIAAQSKLADPRLLRQIPNLMSPPLTRSLSPDKSYQSPQFNQETPQMNMFPFNPPMRQNFPNENHNIGNQTPIDPFLNDPYPNMGGMTPGDPFSSNYDVDMRDRTRPNPNMQFQNNFGDWNQGNQEQYQFEEDYNNHQRFQNFGRFPQNQRQHQGYQNYDYDDQNFSPYDLSQMTPIDFYDTEGREQEFNNKKPGNHHHHDYNTQNQMNREFPPQNNRDFNPPVQNNRPFRGRGLNNNPRGSFRGRGHNSRVQWVNPTIRDDPKNEEYRKPPTNRFSNEHTRFSEELPKDPRKSRFPPDEMKHRSSRFSSDDREDPGRRYSRFSSHNEDVPRREDPRRRSYERKPEEIKETKDTPKKKDEIFSPLNTLYSLDTKPQVGKGYGIQNFKIPKIRKSIDEKTDKEVKKEPEKPKEAVETVKVEEIKDPEPEPEEKVEEISKPIEEPKTENTVEEIVKIEEEKKPDEAEEVKIEANTSTSSKEESTGEASTKTEADEKLDMFNKFMKHIFDTCDSSVLLQYLDKCGFSLPQAKTKRIRRIIESDSESEEDEVKEDKPEEPLEQKQFKQPEQKIQDQKTEEKKDISEDEIEQDVIESVGERIKNRRRKQLIYSSDSSPEKPIVTNEESPVKQPAKKGKNVPKTRRKNALELLQDDLREMFISKGVLTATGKRMCRMMKEHQESGGLYSEISPKKTKDKEVTTTTTDDDDDIPLAFRKFGPKFTKKLPKPQPELKPEEPTKILPIRKTRSSPRVLLEKINLPTSKSSSETSDNENEPEIKDIKRNKRSDSLVSVEPEPEPEPEPVVAKTGKRKRNRRRRGRRRRKNFNKEETENNSDSESLISEVSTKPSETIGEPEIEPEIEPETEPEKKKPMGKKKKNNWAHGVIKRGRKSKNAEKVVDQSDQISIAGSLNDEPELEPDPEPEPEDEAAPEELESNVQNSDNEEYALLKIDIKPDVNYFLDNGNKFYCKLCDYKGKLIVPHYRTRHPESENMISRLSPDQAEKAKIESKLNKFEAIAPFEELVKGKKRRTTYVCRFCTLTFKQEFTSSFFDHICCHTGEYRYSCENCSFLTGVKKTLSAHCHNHPEMKRPLNIVPLWPAPPNFRIVFGYLCKACNFTQLLKPNIDKHVKVSHPGINIEVIKISMSSKPVNLDDLESEEIAGSSMAAIESLEILKEKETIKEKTPEPVKEPDMTAFLEPDDIPLREQLIEDERLKKMEEISSNITPRRSTLQFVDQLKTKLQNVLSNADFDEEDIEEIEKEEPIIDIENHQIDDVPELEEIIPDELNLKITSTCSLAGIESSENEIEVDDTQNSIEEDDQDEIEDDSDEMDISNVELTLDSKQKGVLDTIQRLAAKLQTPRPSLPSDNSSDQLDFEVNSQDNLQNPVNNEIIAQTINVGAIEVIIKESEQQYICLVPNCGFTSLYKISFRKHCSDNHQKLLVNCDICQKDNITLKPFTMTSLFVHLFDKHKENSKNDDSSQPPKIRLRRISGDLLSKPTVLEEPIKVEDPVEPLLEALSQPIIFQPLDEPLKIIETQPTKVVETPSITPLGFLQIKDVRTLTPEEEHNLQPSTSVQVTNVSTVTTVTTSTGKKILQTKKILVPFKDITKYITVKKTGNAVTYKNNNKKPVVCEKEILNCNKTKKIFSEMLKHPKILDLYKCPIELCSYSTNVKLDFSTHFTNHRWCQITSCVYCHEGISSNNIIPHIDKYHSHCNFQCGFCFYRSINRNYLLIHQQFAHGHNYDSLIPNTHNNMTKFYPLKPGPSMFPYFNVNDFLVNSRQSMVLPYICQQNGCNTKFLIADDFMVHLHVYHKKNFECGLCEAKGGFFMTANALIVHYVQHFIGRFQCRFCLFGSSSLAMMYSHYARKHPAMRAICYARQFQNKNLPHNTHEDLIEIDMEKKMYFEKSIEAPTVESQNPPECIPISSAGSSPTVTTTVTVAEPVIDQSSSTEDLKPIVANPPAQKDLVSRTIEPNTMFNVIDLSDYNPENEVEEQSLTNVELNEPLVTLKHRSVESKNAVENAIDPLSVETDFENIIFETLDFNELIPNSQGDKSTTEKSLDSKVIPTSTDKPKIPEKPQEIDSSDNIEPNVAKLTGSNLFKCGNPNCRYKTSKISDFKIHLFTCDIMGENLGYKCYHCQEIFNTVTGLCEHIPVHGIKRFECGLCPYQSALSILIIQHMKIKHKVDYTKFEPVENTKKDMSKDCFIVWPITKNKSASTSAVDPKEHLTISPKKVSIFESAKNKKTAPLENDQPIIEIPQMSPQKIAKNIFGPEDMDLLPRPPVYSSEIKCKLCNYNTKVRSNMQRHLQQHIDEKAVSETAPINPVPCLEKNEKMFDKMTNLAASSHYGRMGGKNVEKPDKNVKEDDGNYPGFVPANKRFVCGAENCNYLTHGDTMLRHHLTALHADETSYKCPHCQIDIPCDVDGLEIDQILFHIKMHDLHLYKCPNCVFFHYQKHKMERHLIENHPEMDKNYKVIRELDNSANLDDSRPSLPVSLIEQVNTETSTEFKPWRCGFCNYRTTGRSDIQNHCSSVHNIKSQFKCGLCQFRCSAKNNYAAHYKKNHPDMEISMVSVYFKVTEEEEPKTSNQEEVVEKTNFDTTPLWVKNKSGVKHIRGILLEETKTSSKRTPKIIEKLTELKTGEETSKAVEDITKNLFSDVKSEKSDKPEKETKKPTKEPQKSLDLAPKYPSHFGAPDGNFYVCPTCEKFKTKSVKDFIGHLHAEMNYFRCACQLCHVRFADISQAKIHWSESHQADGKEEKITPLTPDGKVENWVDNCIRYQHKKMKKVEEEIKDDLDSSIDTVILQNTVNISPEKSGDVDENLEIDVTTLEEPKTPKKAKIPNPETQKTPTKPKQDPREVSPSKLQCQHCSFIAKTPQTFRKHTKRHITFKPFKCNNCSFTTVSSNSVLQHHRAKHKELVLSYTETAEPKEPVIRALKRKRSQNDAESSVPAKILAKTDIKKEIEGSLTAEQKPEVVQAGVPTPESKKTLEVVEETTSTTTDNQKVTSSEDKSDFDIIYVCFHCPRKSEDLEVVRLHYIGSHDKIPKDYFKYKKITIDKNKKTQYKCNYCTWFGHPDGLKQHHLDNHNDKTWICQKAIKYRCTNCKKIFPKIQVLRKHFFMSHPKKNLSYQTVLEDDENECLDTTEVVEIPLDIKPDIKTNNCEYCSDCFETSEQLIQHHNLLHSHLELQSLEELKKYKCPQCGHTSNSYPAMRDHLRSHNKPYCCTHCKLTFSYPNQLKSHHLKEHRLLPLGDIKEQPDIKKLMDKLREAMLILGPDGTYSTKTKTNLKRGNTDSTDEPPAKVIIVETNNLEVSCQNDEPKKINVARKSTSLPAIPKNVARKSTSNRPLKPEGYSFYGTKACDLNDYKNVMSEINIMGKIMPINVVAMSHVLNLFPTVVVTDFKKTQNPQNL